MRKTVSLLLFLGLLTAGCGPTVDLSKALEVKDVSTAWLDAGIVDGANKLVPTITFTLVNHSDQRLDNMQLNVLFRRVSEPNEDWGSGFVVNAVPEGLMPGATTKPFTVKSQLGYKGTDPREQLLTNSQFVDAKVDLFAKYSSVQWKKVGEFPVTRELKEK